MKLYTLLNLLRRICAVIVILLISLTFFDIYSFTSVKTARLLALSQFIPSLLSFIHSPSVIFSSFILFILLTIASGRSYCSFLCPLGIFQDIIGRITSTIHFKKKYRYTDPHDLIRYSIFAIIIISYASTGTFLLIWLDPFSIYGRFSSGIISHAVTGINNISASVLSEFNIYSMHSVDIIYPNSILLLIFTATIVTISIIAVFKGRLYCNTICPVGSMLGLVSKISFLKIKIDKERCIHCAKCETICKSSCIEHENEYIDFSRCVSCFNCLQVCPNSSIKFKSRYSTEYLPGKNITGRENNKSHSEDAKIARKTFLAGIIALPSLLSAQISDKKQVLYIQDRSKQKEYKKKIFTPPPGSGNIERFNERCTACSLCITKCPSSVLRPAVMQYGINGILQPFMDFNTGYCNYDCTICSEVCPAGAINKISKAEKYLIQTGKSFFIKENCITYTNDTACGACSEHCPSKAVYMIPFKNSLVIPEVNQAICIGCGACEYVCPVRPLKAIYVEGNRIHERAELPKKEKKIIIEKEDFPF